MTPEERAGFAAAITEAIARACDELRREHATEIAALRQVHETFAHAQQQLADQAVARAERADARAEQLARDLAATRELAAAPAITEGLIDAAGVLRIVQRSGATVSVPIADLPALLDGLVATRVAAALVGMQSEVDAQVARGLMRLGDAPQWLQTAVYRAGAIVTCYNGRVYELRDGVAGSIAQEPGHHPKVWARIGSGGIRVMKAKPEAIEPGDLFADREAHFISDGITTSLLSAKPFKLGDAERLVKPVQAETRALVARTAAVERAAADAERVADEAAATARSAGEVAAAAAAQSQKAIDQLDELLGPDQEAA